METRVEKSKNHNPRYSTCLAEDRIRHLVLLTKKNQQWEVVLNSV